MGEVSKQFAGCPVVSPSSVFGIGEVAKIRLLAVCPDASDPIPSFVPTYAFVRRSTGLSSLVLVVLSRRTFPKIGAGAIKPIPVSVVNVGFWVNGSGNESVQVNVLSVRVASGIDRATANNRVPLESGNPLGVRVIYQSNKTFSQLNFSHLSSIRHGLLVCQGGVYEK